MFGVVGQLLTDVEPWLQPSGVMLIVPCQEVKSEQQTWVLQISMKQISKNAIVWFMHLMKIKRIYYFVSFTVHSFLGFGFFFWT